MLSHSFIKYAFRIRTRMGVAVERLMIHGRDEFDAKRKLEQVYPGCQIMECVCHHGDVRVPVTTFENMTNPIVR